MSDFLDDEPAGDKLIIHTTRVGFNLENIKTFAKHVEEEAFKEVEGLLDTGAS